jgi:hypothetical protein
VVYYVVAGCVAVVACFLLGRVAGRSQAMPGLLPGYMALVGPAVSFALGIIVAGGGERFGFDEQGARAIPAVFSIAVAGGLAILTGGRRRPLPWDLLLYPGALLVAAPIWFALALLVISVRFALVPGPEDLPGPQAGVWDSMFMFILLFAPLPAALGAGCLVTSLVVWRLPPARRALYADVEADFVAVHRQALKARLRFTSLALVVGLGVSLAAAFTL